LGEAADNDGVKSLSFLFASALLGLTAMAGTTPYPPDAPVVDSVVRYDAQQDSALASFEKQVALVAAKPTVEDIDALAITVRRLADLENKSMSSAFNLTSGRSVRSVSSAEMEAHLNGMKAFKRAQELLDEARDSANGRIPRVAQLRLAAAAKEIAKARKHVGDKRKARPKKQRG
jgi:hypothetical protein